MRVGYICSDVDVEVFGTEGCSVHVREFTNALVDLGHDVLVVCAWGGERHSKTRARIVELLPSGLDAVAWKHLEQEPAIADRRLERDLRSVLWNQWLQTDGARWFERHRPDFLYERYALFGWAGRELADRFGIPLILELNAPLCDQQRGYKRFVLTETARAMEGTILRRADGVLALSEWLRDWAVEAGVPSDRIRVLPDGVARGLFERQPVGAEVRRRHGLEGTAIVGFVGSFHWWHDLATLVTAFSRVHRSRRDARLLLVGQGEGREKVERRIAEEGLAHAVTFTGRVSHEEVPDHLAAMDVSVVPYKPTEDFFFSPLKLFESMAAGVPTVAASLGQIESVVDHGETGWLYSPGDPDDLAAILEAVLANPAAGAAVGTAGRGLVLERFTWDRVAGQVTEWASELIEMKRDGAPTGAVEATIRSSPPDDRRKRESPCRDG